MDSAIKELKRNYAKELPRYASELHQCVENTIASLRQPGATTRSCTGWERIEALAHKLGGSSGTYGFLPLSNVCRYLEDLLLGKA